MSASDSKPGAGNGTTTSALGKLDSIFREDEVEPLNRATPPGEATRVSDAIPLMRFDPPAESDLQLPPAAIISKDQFDSIYQARQSLLYEDDEPGETGAHRRNGRTVRKARSRASFQKAAGVQDDIGSKIASRRRVHAFAAIATVVVAITVVALAAGTGGATRHIGQANGVLAKAKSQTGAASRTILAVLTRFERDARSAAKTRHNTPRVPRPARARARVRHASGPHAVSAKQRPATPSTSASSNEQPVSATTSSDTAGSSSTYSAPDTHTELPATGEASATQPAKSDQTTSEPSGPAGPGGVEGSDCNSQCT